MRTHWLNLDEYRGVICVSPTAARALVAALDQYWPMPPVAINWLCNGPRTAEVMQQAGISVHYPAADYTAEAVLALPQTEVKQDDKWLVVKGQGGRQTFQQTLTERGARVTELIVYERRLDTVELAKLPDLAASCAAIWLSSAFLADQLMVLNGQFWPGWSGQWWVSSPRLAQWCHDHQLQHVVQASGATPEALSILVNQLTGEL